MTRSALAASDEQGGEALKHWTGSAGLSGIALEGQLQHMTGGSDVEAARRRATVLAELLAAHPLSASNWLSLAGMRLVAGQSYDTVLGALQMSSLTGPNEGNVMLQRATFGLLEWELLPADARRRTIDDMAGAIRGTTVRDGSIDPAKRVLSTKSDAVRADVAQQLRDAGVPASELARMGL